MVKFINEYQADDPLFLYESDSDDEISDDEGGMQVWENNQLFIVPNLVNGDAAEEPVIQDQNLEIEAAAESTDEEISIEELSDFYDSEEELSELSDDISMEEAWEEVNRSEAQEALPLEGLSLPVAMPPVTTEPLPLEGLLEQAISPEELSVEDIAPPVPSITVKINTDHDAAGPSH